MIYQVATEAKKQPALTANPIDPPKVNLLTASGVVPVEAGHVAAGDVVAGVPPKVNLLAASGVMPVEAGGVAEGDVVVGVLGDIKVAGDAGVAVLLVGDEMGFPNRFQKDL